MIIGIKAMVANMVLNVLFVLPLMYFWSVGHVGLALATSVAAYLNAVLLLRGLLHKGIYRVQPGWGVYLFRLGAASGVMAVTIWFMAAEPVQWLGWDWQRRSYEIALLCVAGIGVYMVVHGLLGTRMRHLRAPFEAA